MRRRVLLARLLLLCAAAGHAACQAGAPACPASVDVAAETARVRGVIDEFYRSAQRQDWDAAGELMSAEFEFYTDDATSFDKESYVRVLKQDDLAVEHMELKDMDIQVSGDGRMAWGKFRGQFRSTSHGKPSHVETAETLIFKNEGGAWKIVRAHASVRMLDEPARALTRTGPGPQRN